MHTYLQTIRIAILLAFTLGFAAQTEASGDPNPTLPPELLQELATGGSKGLAADCSFTNLRNCKLPPSRVQRPRSPTAADSARTSATIPVAAPTPAGYPGEYTGLRFGWRHVDGRPAAKDHRFRTNDLVTLWVEVAEPGYVYIVNVDVKGVPTLLWPGGGDRPVESAGRASVLARFNGYPGVERVYAIFTRERLTSPETHALNAHRTMGAPSAGEMNIQFAAIDLNGRVSHSGIAVSTEGRAGTKGMTGVATNFEAAQSSSVIAEPGGIAIMERVIVERFPLQVLALDLIHVSR